MALEDKKYERMFSTDGSDSDKIDSESLNHMEAKFNSNDYLNDEDSFETLAPVLFQLQNMIDEFDSIRDHLVNDIVGAKGDKGDKGDTGAAGTTDMSKLDGSKLPTSSKGLSKGVLWNDKGVVKIA